MNHFLFFLKKKTVSLNLFSAPAEKVFRVLMLPVEAFSPITPFRHEYWLDFTVKYCDKLHVQAFSDDRFMPDFDGPASVTLTLCINNINMKNTDGFFLIDPKSEICSSDLQKIPNFEALNRNCGLYCRGRCFVGY